MRSDYAEMDGGQVAKRNIMHPGRFCPCKKCQDNYLYGTAPSDDNREESSSSSTTSGVAGAIVAGAMGALTLGQAYDEPTQNSLNTQGNYSDARATTEGTNQARGHRRDTTAKGYGRSGSNRQS